MHWYPLIKPLLFRMDAERAHDVTQAVVRAAGAVPGVVALERAVYGPPGPALRQRVWSVDFPSPVGLAAGFDKDARLVAPLLALGFGFVETGTVTPRAQPGNPRPRLFRLAADRALINRMGFNSRGVDQAAERLRRLGPRLAPVGVNVGKNRDTALEEADADYVAVMERVYPWADYIAVNVSSPNTPGLRNLQGRAALSALAAAVAAARERLTDRHGVRRPLLLKLAPELDEAGLRDVVEVALEHGLDGLIATNTTTARDGLRSPNREEPGGLSGRPLHRRALEVVATLYGLSGGSLPIVGVGGIFGAEEAYAFIRAGASLVQVYTGLIYRGPGLVREINTGLAALLKRDGYHTIAEAVGTAAAAPTHGGMPA